MSLHAYEPPVDYLGLEDYGAAAMEPAAAPPLGAPVLLIAALVLYAFVS